MNPPDYTLYNRLAFTLPATSAADASSAVHECVSYSYSQGPYLRTPYPQSAHGAYPHEMIRNSACISEDYSYYSPLIRGFDVSHIRQGSSVVGAVPPILNIQEAPRGRTLRRFSPSIGGPSLQGEPSSTLDLSMDNRSSPLPPYSPLPEIREYQRPVLIQPSDIHAQFGINSSRPRSPFACRHPFSSPPPMLPRIARKSLFPPERILLTLSASSYLVNRRRPRQMAYHERQRNRGATNGGISTLTPSADEVSNSGQVQTAPMAMLRHRGNYPLDPSLQSSIIDVDSIPEEERMCAICHEEYGKKNVREDTEELTEAPFRLVKCGHIFGENCIKTWFEVKSERPCPICRCKAAPEHV